MTSSDYETGATLLMSPALILLVVILLSAFRFFIWHGTCFMGIGSGPLASVVKYTSRPALCSFLSHASGWLGFSCFLGSVKSLSVHLPLASFVANFIYATAQCTLALVKSLTCICGSELDGHTTQRNVEGLLEFYLRIRCWTIIVRFVLGWLSNADDLASDADDDETDRGWAEARCWLSSANNDENEIKCRVQYLTQA